MDKKVNRRDFLKNIKDWTIISGIFCGGFLYSSRIEPRCVEPTYHQVLTEKITKRIKVVHLTDLHLDDDTSRDYVPQMVNNCHPDLILLTGDYLNNPPIYTNKIHTKTPPIPISRLEEYVNRFQSKDGIYACFGNWDLGWEEELFKHTDVKPLRNSTTRVSIGGNILSLTGIDLLNEHNIKQFLTTLKKNTFNVLLHHTPDLIEDILPLKTIDLYLAGHTHGGQLRIPFLRLFQDAKGPFPYPGAILTFSKFCSKYQFGRYDLGQTTLYVNRGIGMEGGTLQFRFFCRPEIAIFDIGPKQALPNLKYISPSDL